MVNVLVVEDDEKLNKIVCGSLKSRGYAATGCLSAVAALEKMGEEKFDIVVSDVMMPGKDGFEFAEEVRAADKDIPVIFMTALGDLPSKQRGFRLGADDYITKPFDMDELLLRVGALLRRANIEKMAEELSKSEILRGDFIANVSHEMKTPLAVIRNYAAALADEKDESVRREYAQTLVSESRRLDKLVTNVLRLSKLENQEIFPEKKKAQLGEEVRKCLLDFLGALEQKEIELVCNIDDMEIYSDADFLNVIWSNLISNAVKFTPAGGKIVVSLKEREGFAVLKVRDTGCGMNAETGARIFDKFYQGDRSHAVEGNGLGLALVKKTIDILGGEIAVESELGKGSEFTVKIAKGAP